MFSWDILVSNHSAKRKNWYRTSVRSQLPKKVMLLYQSWRDIKPHTWETPCLTETVCGIGRSWVRLVDWVWQPRRWIRGPGHPELATEELPRLRPVEPSITPTFFTVCLKRHVMAPASRKLLLTHNVQGVLRNMTTCKVAEPLLNVTLLQVKKS